ncbi:MAG: hypothetical protein R2827_15490 [Bdellovibrionales bacterium]
MKLFKSLPWGFVLKIGIAVGFSLPYSVKLDFKVLFQANHGILGFGFSIGVGNVLRTNNYRWTLLLKELWDRMHFDENL